VPSGTSVVTRVLAVDRAAQTVRLKGPEGRVADFRIQDPADLVGVREGDRVVAVVHGAVIVGLEAISR
jgi:Cu/Ag efflux protein CusF